MISNYEQIRLENIKRNEIYLSVTLGIDVTTKEPSVDTKSTRKRKTSNNNDQNNISKEIHNHNIPLRRSNRVASLATVSYMELPTNPVVTASSNKSNKDTTSLAIIHDNDIPIGKIIGYQENKDVKSKYEPTIVSNSYLNNNAISCGCLNANYNYFMKDENICKPIKIYGKASIMQLSNNNIMPKFNKYPGVIEWLNCMYLWVNIDGVSSDYPNVFSEEGKYMMWFGGSKMHKDSKLTQRLIRISNPNNSVKIHNNNNNNNSNNNNYNNVTEVVLLFVRLPGEPYACLGRLHWVSMDLTSSPIKIKWELIDYHTYFHSSEYFHNILNYANKK